MDRRDHACVRAHHGCRRGHGGHARLTETGAERDDAARAGGARESTCRAGAQPCGAWTHDAKAGRKTFRVRRTHSSEFGPRHKQFAVRCRAERLRSRRALAADRDRQRRSAIASWTVLVLLARRLPPGLMQDMAGMLPACATTMWRLRSNPRVPRRAKAALVFVGIWVISPIDLIPEFLPIIGPLDDILVVAIASCGTPPVESHRSPRSSLGGRTSPTRPLAQQPPR